MGLIKINLKRPTCWRDGASNVAKWDAWDREQRRKRGWRAGLAFWAKTNVPGSRVLLSRHWPHRLCWSWSLWVGVVRPKYDGPRRFVCIIMRQYRSIDVRLWFVKINFHWQDSEWMAAVNEKADAPTIYWKHHLKNAEPLGTA